MADSDSDSEVPSARRQRDAPAVEEAAAEPIVRRQRRAPAEEPADEPVEEVAAAQPRGRRRRGAAEVPVAAEGAAEGAEEAEAPSGPRRSARKPARSAASKRKNLRESRRVLAESGLNAENNREGAEVEQAGAEVEQAGAEVEEEREEGQEPEGEMSPLGMIGAMLKSTVNYLKTDPIENAFGSNTTEEEPYSSLTQLYETAKENPDSPDTLRQVTTDFRTLKQNYHNAGCDTDINISLNPRCIGVKAGLYMKLYDIRKSINESLEQMRPIQQQAVLARINREARPEYNGENDVFVPAGV
jgi:hypothetical protein